MLGTCPHQALGRQAGTLVWQTLLIQNVPVDQKPQPKSVISDAAPAVLSLWAARGKLASHRQPEFQAPRSYPGARPVPRPLSAFPLGAGSGGPRSGWLRRRAQPAAPGWLARKSGTQTTVTLTAKVHQLTDGQRDRRCRRTVTAVEVGARGGRWGQAAGSQRVGEVLGTGGERPKQSFSFLHSTGDASREPLRVHISAWMKALTFNVQE